MRLVRALWKIVHRVYVCFWNLECWKLQKFETFEMLILEKTTEDNRNGQSYKCGRFHEWFMRWKEQRRWFHQVKRKMSMISRVFHEVERIMCRVSRGAGFTSWNEQCAWFHECFTRWEEQCWWLHEYFTRWTEQWGRYHEVERTL